MAAPTDVSAGVRPALRLRPHGHLLRDGIIASVAFLAPVFVVAHLLAAPAGNGQAVFLLQLVVTCGLVVAAIGYFRAAIWVSPAALSERGYFGLRHTYPRAQIACIVRAETFGSGSDPVAQLFACDADGRVLVRMRGQYWSTESMDLVVAVLAAPVTVVPDVLTTEELAHSHPHLPYWFERSRVLLALSIAAAIVAGAVLVVATLILTGLISV